MTKAMIKEIINGVNTNKDIKWDVVENTSKKIVLANSYDECVKFTIKIGTDCITVRDNYMGVAVEYLLKGDSRYDDYNNDIEGVRLAIKATVNYFNHIY